MGNVFYYKTALATIGIAEANEKITHVFFSGEKFPGKNYIGKGSAISYDEKESPLLVEASRQLNEYFNGKLIEFDLPLDPNGTEFMLRVWKALREIPYGETRSYKEIATMIGDSKACRAVGLANNRNPISILIPCHRVIGANGDLVGYGGGLDKKVFLLDLEKKQVKPDAK